MCPWFRSKMPHVWVCIHTSQSHICGILVALNDYSQTNFCWIQNWPHESTKLQSYHEHVMSTPSGRPTRLIEGTLVFIYLENDLKWRAQQDEFLVWYSGLTQLLYWLAFNSFQTRWCHFADLFAFSKCYESCSAKSWKWFCLLLCLWIKTSK